MYGIQAGHTEATRPKGKPKKARNTRREKQGSAGRVTMTGKQAKRISAAKWGKKIRSNTGGLVY